MSHVRNPALKRASVEFDCCYLTNSRLGLSAVPIVKDAVQYLYDEAKRNFQTRIVNRDDFEAVLAHNNELAWVFCEIDPRKIETSHFRGFAVFLPLTADGEQRLLADELDMTKPPLDVIATDIADAAVLYWWIVVAPRHVVDILPTISEQVNAPSYAHLNIIARIGSEDGGKMLRRVGFAPVSEEAAPGVGDLVQYTRISNRRLPSRRPHRFAFESAA